jgi:hypothetical protein
MLFWRSAANPHPRMDGRDMCGWRSMQNHIHCAPCDKRRIRRKTGFVGGRTQPYTQRILPIMTASFLGASLGCGAATEAAAVPWWVGGRLHPLAA